jgi:predicted transcriptional regulator
MGTLGHVDTLGNQFLGIFADIEKCMKLALNRRQGGGRFMELARDYVEAYNLPQSYLTSLQTFSALRNAIDHNSYRDSYPIAEPIPELVDEIRQIRDRIKSPPEALAVLEPIDVCLVRRDELITTALEHVRQYDFSQLPVYESDCYVGILTTNAIARWLAQQIADGQEQRDAPVYEVMQFCEASDRAVIVSDTITAADAIHQLMQGSPDGEPVNALIMTANGSPSEQPIRVIVIYDLPLLSAALQFD